ncbi:nitrate reductase cytochrome c-type subunit [Roseateles sp. YR242]|uniref:nitrate reductase cytochrome c-type subunit n=1 Tax=Roseateles sp. YR242 TaxID=1855305 RepID=UPI000B8305B1
MTGALCMGLMAGIAAAPQQARPQPLVDAARGPTAIPDSTKPPVMGNQVNDDLRRTRNYAQQPPVIPHRVDGYQIDKNFNKCLDCHARAKTTVSQAVPVSITHYIDRDGHPLGQVSTRRYFCMQCHVPQDPVQPIVPNTFQDIDTVIQQSPTGNRPAAPARK